MEIFGVECKKNVPKSTSLPAKQVKKQGKYNAQENACGYRKIKAEIPFFYNYVSRQPSNPDFSPYQHDTAYNQED